jgi:hypothetical protein
VLLFTDTFIDYQFIIPLVLLQVGEAGEATSYFSLVSRRRGCGVVRTEQFQRFSYGSTVGTQGYHDVPPPRECRRICSILRAK